MKDINEAQIEQAAKAFIEDGATLKEFKGISNEEMEAV